MEINILIILGTLMGLHLLIMASWNYYLKKDIQRLMKDFARLLLYICKLEERLDKLDGGKDG